MKFLSLDVEIQKTERHRKNSVVLGKNDNKDDEDDLSSSSEEEQRQSLRK